MTGLLLQLLTAPSLPPLQTAAAVVGNFTASHSFTIAIDQGGLFCCCNNKTLHKSCSDPFYHVNTVSRMFDNLIDNTLFLSNALLFWQQCARVLPWVGIGEGAQEWEFIQKSQSTGFLSSYTALWRVSTTVTIASCCAVSVPAVVRALAR